MAAQQHSQTQHSHVSSHPLLPTHHLLSCPLPPAAPPPPPPPTHPPCRKALPPRQPPKASNRQPSKTEEERLQGILNYRNIVLKVFGETAMADMEVVFPDKKVGDRQPGPGGCRVVPGSQGQSSGVLGS